MTNQQGAPEALPDPSPDQLRAIARTARNSSGSASDDCGPLAYVLHGWRAAAIAFRAQQAALVEAQQPAPSAAAAEPLHITHGPLMRHAAALLRSRKPTLPDHESVAAELEMAADGYPTPAGDPSPEWLEVARIAMEPTPPVESHPEPVGADRYAATLKAQNDQFEHALAELVDLVCPGLDSGNLLVDAKTAGDAAQALRAARAPADSVTAPAGGEVAGPSDDEILNRTGSPYAPGTREYDLDLIRWYREKIATQPAQAADSVLEDAALTFTSAHIDYVARHGGRCRDCADESGVCPGSGLPCGSSRKAIKHVFDALEYGVKNGFIKSPVAARKQGGA